MKKILIILTLFLLNLCSVQANETIIMPSEIGIVKNIEYVDTEQISEYTQVKQNVEIKLSKYDNKTIILENMLTGNPNYDITLKKGMKVILHVEKSGDDIIYSIEGIKRSSILIWLSALFCGLLIYVGRKKGFYSLVSIIITAILITKVLAPMITLGLNPVLSTLLICLISTAATMFLVGGFNRKSSAATLGCTFSLIIASLLAYVTVKFASLTGFSNEYSLFLYSSHPELNFVGILISTIILATLGAVMDVAMSIASTINEISTVDNSKTVTELFKCGMNVGRDIIGTMANTLILVYLGGALPLILLASNIDLQKFFNLNQVVTEIASAIIGSCAIVICVPITAIVASKLVKQTKEKFDFSGLKD